MVVVDVRPKISLIWSIKIIILKLIIIIIILTTWKFKSRCPKCLLSEKSSLQLRVQGWVNWDMLNEIEDFRFEALIGFIMSVSFSRKQANKRKSKWWSLLGRVFILRLVHTPVCTCNGLQDPLSTGTKLVRDEQTSWQSGIQVETDGAVDGMSYLPKFLCWNGNHPPCHSLRRWGLWEGIGPRGVEPHAGIRALVRGRDQSPLSPSLPSEHTVKDGSCLQAGKRLTRYQICGHLGLGLNSARSCEKLTSAV